MQLVCPSNKTDRASAFTIVEAVVALTIIGIGIASFMMAMSQLNKEASVGRNATGAGAALQNQIDLILSDGPFNPQKTNEDGTPQIPPALVPGTRVTNNVPIYREPNTGIIVAGTMTTTVTDTRPGLGPPYIYRATVKVEYDYRKAKPSSIQKAYSVSRDTLRTSDI